MSQANSKQAAILYPPLDTVTHPTVSTAPAAFYLNRSPQTLRAWACKQTGPITPLHINGRLDWKVSDIDRKSTRLNSSHLVISYAVFCLKKEIISGLASAIRPSSMLYSKLIRCTRHGLCSRMERATKESEAAILFFFLKMGPPPKSTLFPSATLFQ